MDAPDVSGQRRGYRAGGRQLVDDVREKDRLTARGLDITVPNVARIYDYILGGKDSFDADRAAAAKILAVIPGGSGPARTNRAFLGRVVHFLAAERGIRQFLDIGSGLPTASNVHEIAQAAARTRGSSTLTTTRWSSCTPRPSSRTGPRALPPSAAISATRPASSPALRWAS
jgi:S-adenosyl methyltransferase